MQHNRLIKMYRWHCDFLDCYLPFKPEYGNYYLRGFNSRYRRILKKQSLIKSKQLNNL